MDHEWSQFQADLAAVDSHVIARQTGYPGLFAIRWLDDVVKYHATHFILAVSHAQLYCDMHLVGMTFPFNDERLYPAIRHGFDQVIALYPQIARWLVQEDGVDYVCYRITLV